MNNRRRKTLATVLALAMIISMLAALQITAGATGVDITDDFEDPNFLSAVLDTLSKNPGDPIYDDEVESITYLDVSNYGIDSLEGIQHFVNLEVLDCAWNSLASLPNLSGLVNLVELYCAWNSLTSLPGLSGLTSLEVLHCTGNDLTSLPNLSGLTNLKRLHTSRNALTALPALPPGLKQLHCSNTLITTLSGLPAGLEFLDCHDCPNLTSINVSGLLNLETINCWGNLRLATLNASGCEMLYYLDVPRCALTTLNLSGCVELRYLYCYQNQLTTFDVTDCNALVDVYASRNNIESLPVLPDSVQRLHVSNNLLESIDNLPSSLVDLGCHSNLLTSVSGLPSGLQQLRVHNNTLTSLDVSGLTSLYSLNCSVNLLTELSALPASLEQLYCHQNRLTSIDLSGTTALYYVDCRWNYITDISDITNNVNSAYIDFNPQHEPGYVAVLSILGVPRTATVGVPLTLSGTIIPAEAAPGRSITWELWDWDMDIPPELTGNVLTASEPGWVEVGVIVADGWDMGEDRVISFTIRVLEAGGGGSSSGGYSAPPVTTVIGGDDTPTTELSSYADELYALGLFRGTGVDDEGLPVFSLEDPLTRLQALILTIRLLGLEEEALAFTGLNPFEDVTYSMDVPYVAFAFDKGITKGVSATAFAPDRHVTCQEFTTFLLRTLAYRDEDNADFVYLSALDIALEIEMYTEEMLEDLNSGAFLRGDAVTAMVMALLTHVNGSDEILLIDTLVEAEVFTREAADAFIAAIESISSGPETEES